MSILGLLLPGAQVLEDVAPVRREVWIARRADGLAGAGSEADAFDGSTATKLDALMRDDTKLPEYTTIHLGPGEFETMGWPVKTDADTGITYGWQPRKGQ